MLSLLVNWFVSPMPHGGLSSLLYYLWWFNSQSLILDKILPYLNRFGLDEFLLTQMIRFIKAEFCSLLYRFKWCWSKISLTCNVLIAFIQWIMTLLTGLYIRHVFLSHVVQIKDRMICKYLSRYRVLLRGFVVLNFAIAGGNQPGS